MPVTTMGATKVLVALSGGVDSSACVYLLQRQGYAVEAVVLDLSPAHAATVEAARESAALLGIPLHVVRDHEAFTRDVVLPFCRAYRAGRTPNPCILCNPSTKFRLLAEAAGRLGCSHLATGHYASVRRAGADGSGAYWELSQAACLPRDQSYMLYRLDQAVLSRLLLPLQGLAKDEVRRVAAEAGLPCATRPDSQEICFIPDGGYPDYIEALLGPCPPGDFVAPDGSVCGRHKGVVRYTVGQRKGLGIALGRPVFVSRIDPASNRVYLAEAGGECAPGVLLEDCVFHPALGPAPDDAAAPAFSCAVKIRSMAAPAPAVVQPLGGGKARVAFETPQRAPAPGQSVVWYRGGVVLGGGLIAAPL